MNEKEYVRGQKRITVRWFSADKTDLPDFYEARRR